MTTRPFAMNRPQYFHLLWDEEIDRLREILQALRQREGDVLSRWYQLYTVHFGEAATLSQREVMTLYGHDLIQTVTHLPQGDADQQRPVEQLRVSASRRSCEYSRRDWVGR